MRYLKKVDAPDDDYHIWTAYLEARGDMLPYDPSGKGIPSYAPERKVPLQDILEAQISQEQPEIVVPPSKVKKVVQKRPIKRRAGA